MTPKVRDEAACLLLSVADLWRRFQCSPYEAVAALGRVPCAVQIAANAAIHALWQPSPDGPFLVRGRRCEALVNEFTVWQEAAGLLLDGWNPGDKVRTRGCR